MKREYSQLSTCHAEEDHCENDGITDTGTAERNNNNNMRVTTGTGTVANSCTLDDENSNEDENDENDPQKLSKQLAHTSEERGIGSIPSTTTTTNVNVDNNDVATFEVLTPPPSPPPSSSSSITTSNESQQHPKILGFHVFSTKRSLKRQRSTASLVTVNDTISSNTSSNTQDNNNNSNNHDLDSSTSISTDHPASTSTTITAAIQEVLPISILQRIYEHIPLPPIQPVTDDELVRYTMISVNAIRNNDIPQLRTILLQHPPTTTTTSTTTTTTSSSCSLMIPPPSHESSLSTTTTMNNADSHHHNHHHHSNAYTTTTTTTLSWFDGRNRNGESLLHLACRRSTVEVVKFLIHEAQVNVYITDLCGRTCLHDICWRPRVEEALPIFHVVRQHYMTTLHAKRIEEQQERLASAIHPNQHPTAIDTEDMKSVVVPVVLSSLQSFSMWPFQPDIRGHVCYDYCRQEHWYEWNTYLQEQINQMTTNSMSTSHQPSDRCLVMSLEHSTTTTETEGEQSPMDSRQDTKMKSSSWCSIVLKKTNK